MKQNNRAADLLQWYLQSGVNEVLEDQPVNRFRKPEPGHVHQTKIQPTHQNLVTNDPSLYTTPVSLKNKTPVKLFSKEEVTRKANISANEASSLKELKIAIEAFEDCPLKVTAKNLVFGDGPMNADLMFIGEAPGAEEDRHGVPFIGPAGKMLDRMLAAIKVCREDAYITNILPWRPPGNRTPTDSEISACIPFIERHIELINPKILVLVGGTAAKTILETNQGIIRSRGKWYDYSVKSLGKTIPARAILHPAYLLRSPAHKKETWFDLLEISQKLLEI